MIAFLSRIANTAWLAYHTLPQARDPYRPLHELRQAQSRRLQALLAYAYRWVPYYGETFDRLGLAPRNFKTAADLAQLPLITRDQIQRDPLYFVSREYPVTSYFEMHTSGTTGQPSTFYHDDRAILQYAAQGARLRAPVDKLLDRRVGYRKTLVLGPRSNARRMADFYAQRTWIPGGIALQRQYLSVLDPLEDNLAAINEFKPDVIHSYGSWLAVLFAHLRDTGVPFHRPHALLYTADGVPEPVRRYILDELRIPLFGNYEATETFNIAFECEQHEGLHVNMDLAPVRLVDDDGRTVPDGDEGTIVVSNLVNRATVLLNYRLGDGGAFMIEPCPCGRTLPRLSLLDARREDWITLPSGRIVYQGLLSGVIKFYTQIWQYQIVQETVNHFHMRVVLNGEVDRAEMQERITAEFRRACGDEVSVEVEIVAAIPLSEAGKVNAMVSYVTRPRWREIMGADR